MLSATCWRAGRLRRRHEGPDSPAAVGPRRKPSASARAVEERLFRQHFRHAWIVAAFAVRRHRALVLLAVDETSASLVRTGWHAARSLSTTKTPAAGMPLSSSSTTVFPSSAAAVARTFTSARSPRVAIDHWRALITRPGEIKSLAQLARSSRSSTTRVEHAQFHADARSARPEPRRPFARPENRICEFNRVAHREKISLDSLSAMAGLLHTISLAPSAIRWRAAAQISSPPPPRACGQMLRDTQLRSPTSPSPSAFRPEPPEPSLPPPHGIPQASLVPRNGSPETVPTYPLI